MSDRSAVMQGGAVQQLGTPREIYDNPSSRFVADFIGESNLIPGDELGRDAALTIAVRPERVMLAANGPERTKATIASVTFLGLDTVYDLTLSGGTRVRARHRDSTGLALGDCVSLHWPSEAERELRA